MSLVVVGQAKSGGSTTTAVALAASWPRDVLLVEADPSGGDVAARAGLALVPGLVSLGAAARGEGLTGEAVLSHAQQLGGVVPVVVAPPGAGPARGALAALEEQLAGTLGTLGSEDVIVDVGRIEPADGSPWLRAAGLVVLVARPDAAGVAHLAALLDWVSEAAVRVAVVMIGAQPYGPAEVADALGMEVAGALAFDPKGAAALGSGVVRGYLAERSPLRRSARTLAPLLAARLAEPVLVEGGHRVATAASNGKATDR
ncbi:MAG: hypothetical protein AB1679_34730 [Actinomycetota bacterium]